MLAAKFAVLLPHLDERQRRLLAGAEARSLGHGGIRVVARAAGMREATVSDGAAQVESGVEPLKGGVRILGVPLVGDHVTRIVVAGVIKARAEPVFHPDSYGYRPGRSALDAVAACRELCWRKD